MSEQTPCRTLSTAASDVVLTRPAPRVGCGPGSELKKILARIGIVGGEGCSCDLRAYELDLLGCEWVESHADIVVGCLREQARSRGLPFLDVAGRMLVRRAIKNARRNA